ncbi:hypothetical protein ABZ891_13330 [Streptomyces sp. NPDC047023]|uniref:hypothetical protein n=1 Tax=Streptomyces sp. NPDC047023 TaxID=3155139 RepID=UPI0033F9F8C4
MTEILTVLVVPELLTSAVGSRIFQAADQLMVLSRSPAEWDDIGKSGRTRSPAGKATLASQSTRC